MSVEGRLTLAFGNGLADLRPRRIGDAHEADEAKVAFQFGKVLRVLQEFVCWVRGGPGGGGVEVGELSAVETRSKGKRAQSLALQVLHVLFHRIHFGSRERRVRSNQTHAPEGTPASRQTRDFIPLLCNCDFPLTPTLTLNASVSADKAKTSHFSSTDSGAPLTKSTFL